MEANFKRYISDFYRSLMYDQAILFLERYFTNELKFEDKEKQRYRSSKELEKIKTDAKKQCEAMTRELVDELEAEGIVSPEDFKRQHGKKYVAEEVLEKYLNRLGKYLRGLK